MKEKKIFSVYYVDTQKNDIRYIRDYNSAEEIAEDYKLKNKKSVYNYIIDSIDNIMNVSEIKNTLKNNYIIFRETINESELY